MARGLRVTLVLGLLLGTAVMTGCQNLAEKATEKAIENATGVSVDEEGGSVTIKTEEGEATFSDSAKLPDDFPKDVPVYKNATIDSAMTSDADGGGTVYLVGMTSDDDAGAVCEWYKKEFESGGWTITSSMDVGDSVGGVNAEKGDLSANVSIGYGAEKKAGITLTVAPKQ